MPKYKSYDSETEQLFSEGLSSESIAEHLSGKYNDKFLSSNIRKRITAMGLRDNTVSTTLENNGMLPENWNAAWIKSKEASVYIRNGTVSLEAIREGYVDAVKEAIKSIDSKSWGKIPIKKQSNNLFVPCIFDLHIGKLAWGQETGENYDYKIAIERFRYAIEDMIYKASSYDVERILFPVGNDIYNSDKAFPFPQTTKGTPQMDDIRWQKLFRVGVQLITEAIIRLSKIAPVDTFTVFSNHDHERVFYLGETLTAVFDSHPNVMVNNKPPVRKYYKWGENLIGLAHGHNEKPQDLPSLMSNEQPKLWGETTYRYWLLGHLHHRQKYLTQQSKDYRSVNVTYITSPSAADAWHSEKGFVGSIKGAEGFIYNKEEGLIGTVIHNIK